MGGKFTKGEGRGLGDKNTGVKGAIGYQGCEDSVK